MAENQDPSPTRPVSGSDIDPPIHQIPPFPTFPTERTKWFTIFPGRRHWLCYSKGIGDDRFFISKGARRVIHSYPLTEAGWTDAWTQFAELEPDWHRDYLSDQRRAAERAKRPKGAVALGFNAIYTGGLADHPLQARGTLLLSPTQIGLGEFQPERAVILLDDVASVEITGDMVAKSKLAATLAFGVLGGVGSKGTKTEVAVIVRLKSGGTAYYVIPDSNDGPSILRAKAGPVLQQAGVPFADDGPALASAGPDIADQLRKLADMRNEGLLSPEEFERAKAKLLA
jgi:hypothetical protein